MSDLTFNGGATGASMGNQQYTMRNLVFNNCGTAIIQLWDWGWTYIGLKINNCGKGIDISAGGSSAQDVGSITLIDSTITNTPVGLITAYSSSSQPATAGSIVLENVVLQNVPVAVQGPSGTLLSGGSSTISAWSSGHRYTPNGPQSAVGASKSPENLPRGFIVQKNILRNFSTDTVIQSHQTRDHRFCLAAAATTTSDRSLSTRRLPHLPSSVFVPLEPRVMLPQMM
jgi:hypothetical protein